MVNIIIPVVSTLAESGLSFIPRVTISHDTGRLNFNDLEVTSAQQQYIIMLGAIRQRVMWNPNPGSLGILECDSKDFEHGNPKGNFPWEDSNFDKPDDTPDDFQLQCGACIFAKWTADPSIRRGSKPARCTETVVVPLLMPSDPNIKLAPSRDKSSISYNDIAYKVGAMSFQKSSIKPIADHMRGFRLMGLPAYSSITSMMLNINLGSGFKYSVPSLTSHNKVSEESYPLLSTILREAREIVTKPTPVTPAAGFLDVGATSKDATGYTGTFFS